MSTPSSPATEPDERSEREALQEAEAQIRHLVEDLTQLHVENGLARYEAVNSLMFSNCIAAMDRLLPKMSAALSAPTAPAPAEPVTRVHTTVSGCDDCPACVYTSAARYSCERADYRKFDADGKSSVPPEWCPLPLLATPTAIEAAQPEAVGDGSFPPRNIIWDSLHPDYPVEWSNPGRAAREGEVHYIRYDLFSEAVHASLASESVRPDILERLSYHARERDDLTLDDCLSYLAKGWRNVHGRTERQMVMQILELLASAPITEATSSPSDAERYRLVRRGQHWSVIDGMGNVLRGDDLDTAVDAIRATKGGEL